MTSPSFGEIFQGATVSGPKEAKYLAMSEKDVSKELKRLEKEMWQAAKNLKFEKATKLRVSVLISPL